MADDTRLAITIEANTKSMENALKRLEGTVSKSMATQTRSVKSLDSQLKAMSATAVKAAGLIAGAFSARLLVGFVKSSIEAGAAVGDLAIKLGITAEATQELTYAAEQSGASVDALAPAFKAMAALVVDVERGSKAAKDQLAELGLTLADIRGKSPDQVFELFADRIGKIQDPLQRTNELVKFFGKQGADLGQLAQTGAGGIEALRQKARALGIVLSNETIARAKEAGDKISDIGSAAHVAGIEMGSKFLPAIDAIRDLVTSSAFQQGLSDTASALGQIIEFLAKNPDLIKTLAAAAVGYKFFGPAGAAIGALGVNLAPGSAGPNGQDTIVVDGERITIDEYRSRFGNSGAAAGISPSRSPGSQFDDFGFTPSLQSMPGLASAARGAAAAATGAGGGGIKDQTAEAERLKNAIEDINNQLEQSIALSKRWNDALMDVGGAAFDVFAGILDGTKDAKTAILDFIKQLALAEAKAAFLHLLNPNSALGPIATLLGGQFPGLPGRASGGPVMAGMPYMVGERGPELFIPHSAGRIASRGGANGGAIEVHIISDASPLFVQNVRVQSTDIAVKVTQRGLAQYHRSQQRSDLTGAAGVGILR